MKTKKWTKSQEDYLKANWRTKSDAYIANVLGKSISSIYSKRHREMLVKYHKKEGNKYHYGFTCDWRVKRLLDTVNSRQKTKFIRAAIEYAHETGFINNFQSV